MNDLKRRRLFRQLRVQYLRTAIYDRRNAFCREAMRYDPQEDYSEALNRMHTDAGYCIDRPESCFKLLQSFS
jgi:hypothetical protein